MVFFTSFTYQPPSSSNDPPCPNFIATDLMKKCHISNHHPSTHTSSHINYRTSWGSFYYLVNHQPVLFGDILWAIIFSLKIPKSPTIDNWGGNEGSSLGINFSTFRQLGELMGAFIGYQFINISTIGGVNGGFYWVSIYQHFPNMGAWGLSSFGYQNQPNRQLGSEWGHYYGQ